MTIIKWVPLYNHMNQNINLSLKTIILNDLRYIERLYNKFIYFLLESFHNSPILSGVVLKVEN